MQQSFNGKREYDNRTRLTSWPTAPNGTANVKEEVWPLWKEKFWCTHWVLTRVTKLMALSNPVPGFKGSCPTSKVQDVSGGLIRSPIRLTPNWILSTIYTSEESLGRPPPAGTPAALTYNLTLTYVDWVAILIENSWLVEKCGYG